MQELLTVELPDGKEYEMPRYLAKKFYDFLKHEEKKNTSTRPSDFGSEWLKNLQREDQLKIHAPQNH